jgi:hypothetical protein
MGRLLRNFIVTAGLALGLAACGPMMETRYEFTPPPSKAGMQCVQNCQADQSMCQADARKAQEKCRKDADRTVERQYQKARDEYIYALKLYASDSAKFPKPKEPRKQSASYYQCNNLGSECAGQYNICYRSCGGQILEHQVCVANCDQ